MRARSSTWLRAAAAAGMVASLAQNAWVVEGLVARRYDIYDSYVSDLGAKTEHNWWFWTAADEVAGVGTIVFALAVLPLYRELPARSRVAVAGAIAFLLSGVGTIADGVLRLPCPETLSTACEARLEAGLGGWIYTAHQVESTFTSIVAFAAVVALAWALLADVRWRPAARWMWYLLPPFVLFNLLTGLDAVLDTGWAGLWSRLLFVSTALSTLPPMIRLWQLAPGYETVASVAGKRPSAQPASSERLE